MPKLLRQNVGGTDYSMAGCALTATCATAAATAAKVATLSDGDVLADGMSVAVAFSYGNTADAPLTLTVGGVTAYICDSRGQNIGENLWQAGNIVTFLYTRNKFLLLASTNQSQVSQYICMPDGGAGLFNPSAPFQDDATDTKYGDGRHHVTGLFILGAGNTAGQGIWLSGIPRGDVYNGNSMWVPVYLTDGHVCTALVGVGVRDPARPTEYYGVISIWSGGYAPTLTQNITAFVDFWYQE